MGSTLVNMGQHYVGVVALGLYGLTLVAMTSMTIIGHCEVCQPQWKKCISRPIGCTPFVSGSQSQTTHSPPVYIPLSIRIIKSKSLNQDAFAPTPSLGICLDPLFWSLYLVWYVVQFFVYSRRFLTLACSSDPLGDADHLASIRPAALCFPRWIYCIHL